MPTTDHGGAAPGGEVARGSGGDPGRGRARPGGARRGASRRSRRGRASWRSAPRSRPRCAAGAASGIRSRRSSPPVRARRCPTRAPARGRSAGASGCCSTSARRWTDTAPTSPAPWSWARRADERQRAMYDLVRCAQGRALEHLRPGMTGREGDALARDVIAARGFGEAFGHSLGHGLGLEVHEAPRLAPTSDAPVPSQARWSRSSRASIFQAGAASGWRTTCYLGPDGPELLSEWANRAGGAGVARARSSILTMPSSHAIPGPSRPRPHRPPPNTGDAGRAP